MTEFQGWLLLAMLAFITAAIIQHAGRMAEGRVMAVVGLGFAALGFTRAFLGL